MKHLEQYEDVKLDIQPVGVEMNDYLRRKIYNMVKKLKKFLPELNWIDVYLKRTDETARPNTVTVRFGVPGPDIVATDSGERWKILLKNVEKRIIRQLEKRKVLLNKPAI